MLYRLRMAATNAVATVTHDDELMTAVDDGAGAGAESSDDDEEWCAIVALMQACRVFA